MQSSYIPWCRALLFNTARGELVRGWVRMTSVFTRVAKHSHACAASHDSTDTSLLQVSEMILCRIIILHLANHSDTYSWEMQLYLLHLLSDEQNFDLWTPDLTSMSAHSTKGFIRQIQRWEWSYCKQEIAIAPPAGDWYLPPGHGWISVWVSVLTLLFHFVHRFSLPMYEPQLIDMHYVVSHLY